MKNTFVINVGLNVGTNNALRVNEEMLDKEMQTHAISYFKKIPIRIPKDETYTTYMGTKVEEDTNIYIFEAFNFSEIDVESLCVRYGQICIPYKKYDARLNPVYSQLVFSEFATKEERELYGQFNNDYFCNPFKF